MRTVLEFQLTVPVSVADAFAYVTDVGRNPEWDEQISDVRLMTRGPLRVGTVIRSTVSAGSATQSTDDEVVAFEPNRRFATRSIRDDTAADFSFRPAPKGCAIDVRIEYELPDGATDPPFDAVVERRRIAAGVQHALDRLRDRLAAPAAG